MNGETYLCACCRNTEHALLDVNPPHYSWQVYHCDRCNERCDNSGCVFLPPNSNGTYGPVVRQQNPRIPRRLV